jgi:ATP-binding cassette subfamily F protein 3
MERVALLADAVLYFVFAKAMPLMDSLGAGLVELDQLYARWEAAQEKLAEASASL